MACKIHLIQFAVAVWILKQPDIIYSIASIWWMDQCSSWTMFHDQPKTSLWHYSCEASPLWWWFIRFSDKHSNTKCLTSFYQAKGLMILCYRINIYSIINSLIKLQLVYIYIHIHTYRYINMYININTQNLLKSQIFLFFSEALSMCQALKLDKASEKKRNICEVVF